MSPGGLYPVHGSRCYRALVEETLADDAVVWNWRRVRPWLGPALVRGALWGAAVALCLVVPAVAVGGVKPTPRAIGGLVLSALLCVAAGVLGGAPSAPLEGRARGRSERAKLVHAALSGVAAALGWVFVVAQVVYVAGVAQGGMDRGLSELGRLLGGVIGSGTTPGPAVVVGALLAVAAPFGVAVLLRLRDRPLRAQVGGGCATTGCGGLALTILCALLAAVTAGPGPDPFEQGLAAGGLAAVLPLTGVAALVVALLGAPLSVVAPLALAIADRIRPLPPVSEAPTTPTPEPPISEPPADSPSELLP